MPLVAVHVFVNLIAPIKILIGPFALPGWSPTVPG
jgi:hypothetical protein